MKRYQRNSDDIPFVLNRTYLDVDSGNVHLALLRLRELKLQFPRNARIPYAEGQILRDHLGLAKESRECFELAYQLAGHLDETGTTRWFSICNMVELAESWEDYEKWSDIAIKEMGNMQPECRGCIQVRSMKTKGELYAQYLWGKATQEHTEGQIGMCASKLIILIELLKAIDEEKSLEAMVMRSQCLRGLDRQSDEARTARGITIRPSERLELLHALKVLDEAIEADEYDEKLWNTRSAWLILLERYQEAVDAADKAMKMRPGNYVRPYVNKSFALWDLQKDEEAMACVEQGLNMCEEDEEAGQEAKLQLQELKFQLQAGRKELDADYIMPLFAPAVENISHLCQEEFSKIPDQFDLDSLLNHIQWHLETCRIRSISVFLPKAEELFGSFTPETLVEVTKCMILKNSIAGKLIKGAAIYLASHGKGTIRRDSLKYLCLFSAVTSNSPEILKEQFRELWLLSCTSDDEMSTLWDGIREELAMIHPELSDLLEPKGPITDMDRSKVESALTELYANEIHSPHSIRTLAFITLLLAASVLAAYYIL